MTDQDIDMIEKMYGIQLLHCQKEFLKKYIPGDKLYINMHEVRRREKNILKGCLKWLSC